MKQGIDVSSYQGEINWEITKNEIDFAILRCGYGDNISAQDDAFYQQNAKSCEKYYIPFGVYLYSYATNLEMAQSEVEHTLRLVKDYQLEYPIFLDVEDQTQLELPKDKLIEIVKYYCDKITASGYKVGIYASLNTLNNELNTTILDEFDKWVAQWNNTFSYKKTSSMWQWTNKRYVKGILGAVDGNIAFIDYPKMIREEKLNHLLPLQEEPPAPPLLQVPEKKPERKYKVKEKLYLNGNTYQEESATNIIKTYCNKKVEIKTVNQNKNIVAPYQVQSKGYVREEDLSPVKLTRNSFYAKIIAFIKRLIKRLYNIFKRKE